jgi:hypothetical protein
MATVIDYLLIELGLDTSKFDASQKKSVEELRKLDEQAQKTSKNTTKGAKDMGDGFTAMKDALIGFGTIFVGLNGLKNFVADTTKANVELGRSAHVLNMSAGELKTWGQLAEITGGSVESMTATIKGLQQSLVGLKYGDTAMVNAATQLGAWKAFDINKMSVDLFKLSDAIVAYRKTHTEAETVNFTSALGIDQSSLLMLEKGSQYLHQHGDEFDKLNASMNKNAETASKLTEQWVFFKSVLDSIAQSAYGKIMDFLFIRKPNTKLTDEEWNKGAGYTPSSSAGSSANPNFGELEKKNGLPPGMLDKIWKIESNRGQGNMVSPAGATGHFQFMPDTAKQYGLSRADTFDIGKSSEAAAKMFADLLRKYKGNVDMALAAYNWGSGNIQKYGMNHLPQETAGYLNKYHSMVGANVNAPSSANGKTVTSSVNIQNQVINTQATNADGIAKDMHTALAQNTLINAGIVGTD